MVYFGASFFLIAAAVFKADAAARLETKPLEDVGCVSPYKTQMTATAPSYLTRDQLHPFQICVEVSKPVVDCTTAVDSKLTLVIEANKVKKEFPFTFKASQVKEEYCQVVEACDVAKAFANQTITGATVTGMLTFAAASAASTAPAQFKVKVLYMDEKFTKVDETKPALADQRIQAFTCQFKDCQINSEPVQERKSTNIFTILDGESFPRCEEAQKDNLKDGQFSVTTFGCLPNCAKEFKAISLKKSEYFLKSFMDICLAS